MTKLNSPN